jgi:hypothetical protein
MLFVPMDVIRGSWLELSVIFLCCSSLRFRSRIGVGTLSKVRWMALCMSWQVGESTSSVAVFTNPFNEPVQVPCTSSHPNNSSKLSILLM